MLISSEPRIKSDFFLKYVQLLLTKVSQITVISDAVDEGRDSRSWVFVSFIYFFILGNKIKRLSYKIYITKRYVMWHFTYGSTRILREVAKGRNQLVVASNMCLVLNYDIKILHHLTAGRRRERLLLWYYYFFASHALNHTQKLAYNKAACRGWLWQIF